jgi:hypothetical protein
MVDPPALTPASARPSSISTADMYGPYATGIPSTVQVGTAGYGAGTAQDAAMEREAPVTVNGLPSTFLQRPAGVVVVLIVFLLLLSLSDGG